MIRAIKLYNSIAKTDMKITKRKKRVSRHARVRARIKGTANTPRVSVFRSNRHVFVQIIDDTAGRTLMGVGDILKVRGGTKGATKIKKENKTMRADLIGEVFAKKAKETGIDKVVFDRGGYKYHGRVKALAEGLRKGGLRF